MCSVRHFLSVSQQRYSAPSWKPQFTFWLLGRNWTVTSRIFPVNSGNPLSGTACGPHVQTLSTSCCAHRCPSSSRRPSAFPGRPDHTWHRFHRRRKGPVPWLGCCGKPVHCCCTSRLCGFWRAKSKARPCFWPSPRNVAPESCQDLRMRSGTQRDKLEQ